MGRNAATLFITEGQIRSAWQFASVDGRGNPIPWLTYPAIKFLDTLDLSDTTVLEYGSGASTSYWSRRVRKVASVENNGDWYRSATPEKLRNVDLVLSEVPEEYPEAGRSFGDQFGLVLIDGIEREQCARVALSVVRDDGMIILDNSGSEPGARRVLATDNRFFAVDFEGFSPINGYCHVTTIFISRTCPLV
jgi:hypothetical protein